MERIEFIDTHVHLDDEAFADDFNQIVERMESDGVIKCIIPGIDSSNYQNVRECAAKLPNIAYEAIGVHPTSIKDNYKEELDFIYNNISDRHIAIGEIGFDGYWSKEHLNEQRVAFEEQIVLACEKDLPVIIHLRDATEQLFQSLDRLKGKPIRGVFHAYSGSSEMFERLRKYGDFYFGIGGVVTYKKASIAESLTKIPLERLVLETDAPWLTPVPFRGKRNESSYIKYIAEKIAEIKNDNLSNIANTTTKNALSLFNINS